MLAFIQIPIKCQTTPFLLLWVIKMLIFPSFPRVDMNEFCTNKSSLSELASIDPRTPYPYSLGMNALLFAPRGRSSRFVQGKREGMKSRIGSEKMPEE